MYALGREKGASAALRRRMSPAHHRSSPLASPCICVSGKSLGSLEISRGESARGRSWTRPNIRSRTRTEPTSAFHSIRFVGAPLLRLDWSWGEAAERAREDEREGRPQARILSRVPCVRIRLLSFFVGVLAPPPPPWQPLRDKTFFFEVTYG